MKKIIYFLLIFPLSLVCQEWVDKMQDANNNFYTQNAFDSYWENRTIEKGKGWKQYKRWKIYFTKGLP